MQFTAKMAPVWTDAKSFWNFPKTENKRSAICHNPVLTYPVFGAKTVDDSFSGGYTFRNITNLGKYEKLLATAQ